MHAERLVEEEIMAWGTEDKLTKTCCMLVPYRVLMAVSAQVCALLALTRARTMDVKVSADA